jgi:hypothetical protein
MARKPNYDFEKRRKEQERKAKKDAKRADRQQRRDDARAAGIDPDLADLEDLGVEVPEGGDVTVDQADGAEDGPPGT